MKLRSSTLHACVVLIGLSACSDPDTIDYPRPSYSDSTAPAATGAAQSNPMMNPTAQQSVATGPAPKINPAHGEPGHRCDIAVGAPLDGSAPAPKVVGTPTVTQSPVQLTPQVTQVSTTDKAAETPASAPEATPDQSAPADNEQPAKPE